MTPLSRQIDKARTLAKSDPAAAVRALDTLRRSHPANPRASQALRKIGQTKLPELMVIIAAALRRGAWEEALSIARPLAASDPTNASLVVLTAEALCTTSQHAMCLRLLEKALHHHPGNADLWVLKGKALRLSENSASALPSFRQALKLMPSHAGARNCYGLAQLDLGNLEEAIEAWKAGVNANPRAADSWLNLAPHIDFSAEPEMFAKLTAAAQLGGLSTSERECFDFALATANLQMGVADQAFKALHRANTARRNSIGYRPAQDEFLFSEIKRRFADLPKPEARKPKVVLITGLPRSGTTLTEQILSAHGAVQACGELDALTRAIRPALAPDCPPAADDLGRIAAEYRDSLTNLSNGAPLQTDKMPLNFRWIGPVLAALPEARIIHVTRDPHAVALSLYRHRFSGQGNGFCYELKDIAAYIQHERDLMAFWRERWSDRIFDLSYEALTEAPDIKIRALLEFCDLPFEAACLEPHLSSREVHTASAAQVRKPIYKRSSKDWQRYSRHLKQIDHLALTSKTDKLNKL